MDPNRTFEVQALMARFRSGDSQAAADLVELFYPELKRLAAARMSGENAGHTWTPTVLVNELYLELVKIRALRDAAEDENERQSFLALAGFIMRRLLIHHSRPLYRKAEKVDAEVLDQRPSCGSHGSPDSLAEIEDMLKRLEEIDPQLRRIVEMRVFEGRAMKEIAEAAGCTERTVQSRWSFARRWLEHELAAS
jgi:RNA polymerase sigma factor (TIGR02999 family)